MDTHKIKQLADDIAAVGRAEAWLEEYGDTVFHEKNPRFTIHLDYAGAVNGHAEAQSVVQEVVQRSEEILTAALALCASKHRELTDALRAEIVS